MLGLLLAGALSAAAAPAAAAPVLEAAAGKADITPDPAKDRVWLAGYGAKGRRAEGVADPLFARALLLRLGSRKVALVSVDAIGVFREDVLSWREGYDGALFVTATHTHSAPDSMGLWGPLPGVSGVSRRHRERIRRTVRELLARLEGELGPSRLKPGRRELDPRGLCRDTRDPAVLDPELGSLRVERHDGRPVATLVRWSCHAVALTGANKKVSADFPGRLCAAIEAAKAGECLFLPGAIGGHLIPDTDRKAPVEAQFAEAERIGAAVARAALEAVEKSPPAVERLEFSSAAVRVPVENSRYLAFLPSLVFGHRLFDAEGRELPPRRAYWLALRHVLAFPLPERLRPWVETEVSVLRVGPLTIAGVPGEIFPELVLGGYDGARRYAQPLVGPDNPNPPDLRAAPKGPYLRQRLGRHGWVVGLANDELGYFVPGYDFQVAPTRTLLPKPAGTHYEETNSIGPRATEIVLKALEGLL